VISFEKVKPFIPWVPVILLAVAIFLFVSALNRARSAEDALGKAEEREKLLKANLTVEAERSKKDLTAAEKLIASKDADFTAERAKLWKALGEKPKVITVVEWRTIPSPTLPAAPGTPARECPVAGPDGKKPDILVVEGDTGHVEISEVTYETKNNNHVFIGTGSCWRDTPTGRKLWASAVQGQAPVALREKEPTPFRWGVGGTVVATSDKLGAGPVLLFPPFETWGLQWDGSAGAAFSAKGFVAAQGQLGVRWR
jgi:hypothetical protein